MAWRVALLTTVLWAGCSSAPHTRAFSPPESIGPGWKLSATEEVPETDVPPEVQQLGLDRAIRARYSGYAELSAVFYHMSGFGSAFELVQTWRPEPGKLAFHKGLVFVVLEAPDLGTPDLTGIANSIEAQLP